MTAAITDGIPTPNPTPRAILSDRVRPVSSTSNQHVSKCPSNREAGTTHLKPVAALPVSLEWAAYLIPRPRLYPLHQRYRSKHVGQHTWVRGGRLRRRHTRRRRECCRHGAAPTASSCRSSLLPGGCAVSVDQIIRIRAHAVNAAVAHDAVEQIKVRHLEVATEARVVRAPNPR